MSKILTFALDNIEEIKEKEDSLYEQAKKSRFAKVKIRLFGTGENAHTEPVDFDTLKRSADSAYDIPLIAELNPYRKEKDFGGHGILTGKEFSFGFIKESKDNPIVFEQDEATGKTFITLYGLIWKKYFRNIVDILMDRGSETEVSVELEELQGEESENGKLILHQFILNAVTFLGKITSAACKGAMAQLCFSEEINDEFIKDKENYLFEDSKNVIPIENEHIYCAAEESLNSNVLFEDISKAANKEELLNEVYLSYDKGQKDEVLESQTYYPHHIIKDNKLVLHKEAIEKAFSSIYVDLEKAKQEMAHLVRHYKTLGLNSQNFEEFNLTEEQFKTYFAEEIRKEEVILEKENKETTIEEAEEKKVEEDNGEAQMEESKEVETEAGTENFEEDEDEKDKDSDSEDKDKAEDDKADDENDSNNDEKTFEVLEAENEKLKKINEEYSSKIQEMSDYEELKQFKVDTLSKQAKEAEMSEMNKVMAELKDKGVKMSAEIEKKLMNDRTDFSNISAWSNYVKAFAFDNCEMSKEEDIVKIEIPNAKIEEEHKGIWD